MTDDRRTDGPKALGIAPQKIERFVALGDGQMEGLHDYHSDGLPRGWAEQHGVILVEMEEVGTAADPRMRNSDRIHLYSEGREYLARAFARALEGGPRWEVELPPVRTTSALAHLVGETAWIIRFMLPKIVRVVRGRSSGDGRVAKRPKLVPLD